MEPLWKLVYLLEPASLALILTAVAVTFASALGALYNGKEMERNRDFSQASITLDKSQALMIPLASSCTLLLLFYLFPSISHLVTAFTSIASASSIFFCLYPFVAYMKSQLGLTDPLISRCCSKSLTRIQGMLLLISIGVVCSWLISGHWILNNILGISICIAFVSHVRLPNIKICALLLLCLFVYDIFWVFFSERFFGANVMVSVATQQASNPVHTVVDTLRLPGIEVIAKKLDMPVKLLFPRAFLGSSSVPRRTEFMMLGLGDMAIPGMLLALVLCFDHRKHRDLGTVDTSFLKGHKYIWYAVGGYFIGLVTALAAGILSQSAQPALLYLVPSTLGPIIITSWKRRELMELWDGSRLNLNEKVRAIEV